MENKYKAGEVVCERIHPSQTLIVSRFSNGIYYARGIHRNSRKELVFLEAEIKSFFTPAEYIDNRREWQFSSHFPTLLRLWKAVRY